MRRPRMPGNSATTANQSARPPTMAASAPAFISRVAKVDGIKSVMNTTIANAKHPSAKYCMRRNSASCHGSIPHLPWLLTLKIQESWRLQWLMNSPQLAHLQCQELQNLGLISSSGSAWPQLGHSQSGQPPKTCTVTAEGCTVFRPMACRAGVSGCWGATGMVFLDGGCTGSPHHRPVLHQRPLPSHRYTALLIPAFFCAAALSNGQRTPPSPLSRPF